MTKRDKQKIGYKLGALFEDYGVNGGIGFEILFPHTYFSRKEAEMNSENISALMKRQPNGDVIIVLYENKFQVETIRWDEWWKYKCNHIKEKSKDLGFVDAMTDYEPYSEKFEEIFREYCRSKERDIWSMQYLAYWVEPVIVMDIDRRGGMTCDRFKGD